MIAILKTFLRRLLQSKGIRYQFNDDAMATEKTAEGIRKFAVDMIALEDLVKEAINT